MKYDFDQIIDRRHTNAMAADGFRPYLFGDNQNIKLPHPDHELISMWVADMDFAVAPEIVSAIQARLGHPVFGYSIAYEEDYFRVFINWAKKHYDWDLCPEQIMTSQGVIPALYSLVDCVCSEKDKVATMTPCYGYFKHAVEHFGNRLVCSDLVEIDGTFHVDYEDLNTKLAAKDVRLLLLCSPHNPTGRIWAAHELKKIAEICFEHNVLIVSDEVHCDLIRTGKEHIPLATLYPDSDQVVTCMAPSKTFNLAGMMIANIVIPNESIRAKWLNQHYPFLNPLSIEAATAAYQQGQNWLHQLRGYLDANFRYLQSFLNEQLPKANFQIPDATYLAWIDLSAYQLAQDNLTEFFARQGGLLLEGGNMFVANGDNKIRLNVACPRAKLAKGVKIIVDVINAR